MILKKQDEVLRTFIETLEQERKRIAGILQNSIEQILYGIKISLEKLEVVEKKENIALKYKLNVLIQEAIDKTKHLSFELLPQVLKDFGLESCIRDMLKRRNIEGIKFNLQMVGFKDRLPENTEILIFRIIQELVNNVEKHSNCSEASITITRHESYIVINVTDNGDGFDHASTVRKGNGLNHIDSQMKIIKGGLDIKSSKKKGTGITVKIPCKPGDDIMEIC